MSDDTNKQILELVQQLSRDNAMQAQAITQLSNKVDQQSKDIAQLSPDVALLQNVNLNQLIRRVEFLRKRHCRHQRSAKL
jgi:hypothetical protein